MLFSASCPPAISRRVVLIAIDAIDGGVFLSELLNMRQVACVHVVSEVYEFSPTWAQLDTATAIRMIG